MPIADFDPNAPASPDAGIFCLPSTPDDAGVILIPVPWDMTTSYKAGAANGPRAIFQASQQIDLYDIETGRPYRAGIAMLPESSEVRAWNTEGRALAEAVIAQGGVAKGGAPRVDELGGQLNTWLRDETARWLDAGRVVGVVGGDHAAPFGAIEAVAKRHQGVGVLHVDAHADLRDAYEGFAWSHASIMFNVLQHVPDVSRIVQVGIRDMSEGEAAVIAGSSGRVITHHDANLRAARFRGDTWAHQCQQIIGALPDEVYISFDIDGLDPTLCPNTGTPVPGGLSFGEATFLIGEVARSGRRIVGFDLNEVAPGRDGDEWDGNVGMRLLYKLIGWTLRSRGQAFD